MPEVITDMPTPVSLSPKCYFCLKEVTEEDFCFGCGHYVCDECDWFTPVGKHNVEDHQKMKKLGEAN